MAAGVGRIFSEKISTRIFSRPELEAAVGLARELRASGVAVTLVVHEHKRLLQGMALHLRSQELGLREVAAKLVITKGAKKGEHPSPPRSWLTTSVS